MGTCTTIVSWPPSARSPAGLAMSRVSPPPLRVRSLQPARSESRAENTSFTAVLHSMWMSSTAPPVALVKVKTAHSVLIWPCPNSLITSPVSLSPSPLASERAL